MHEKIVKVSFAVFFFCKAFDTDMDAKLLLNYCHMLQLESAITQYYVTRKPFPGLHNILFAVRGCLHFKRASYLSGTHYVTYNGLHEKMMQCM